MITRVSLKLRSVSVNLPFGLGGVEVEVSEAEVRAAWELYVEFATRIVAYPLEAGAGSVSEALQSLYALFDITRSVLRAAGPEVADSPDALGPLAIRILNEGVRPFLVRWHTELRGSAGAGQAELTADRRAAFDRELDEIRTSLAEYVDALARIAGIRHA
jgi:hypothetical protein